MRIYASGPVNIVSYSGYHRHCRRYGFWSGSLALAVFPFLLLFWLAAAELWLCAEILLFAVTAVAAGIALARREVRPADLTVTRLRWGLLILDSKTWTAS